MPLPLGNRRGRSYTPLFVPDLTEKPAVAATPRTPPRRHRPETPEERHARRVAWGKEAGAKVAAAYKQLQEAS
jgi:hypothetical protein